MKKKGFLKETSKNTPLISKKSFLFSGSGTKGLVVKYKC